MTNDIQDTSARCKGGQSVDDIIQSAADAYALRFIEAFYCACDSCESPIEELLLAALYTDHDNREYKVIFMGDHTPHDDNIEGETIYVYQQSKVGPYRVDFLILDASVPLDVDQHRWMIVECDGHDFHERTKAQARHDKARDRFFQSKGYKVLRFTGSEIYASPMDCAEEILLQLKRDDGWRNQ